MGGVIAAIEVGDPQGLNFRPVAVEVDTGSTFTALPREMLQSLGVPVARTVPARLADGSVEEVDLGHTALRLGGRQVVTPVIFAEANEPSLLGVVTLEEALLSVDPVNGELVPVITPTAKRLKKDNSLRYLWGRNRPIKPGNCVPSYGHRLGWDCRFHARPLVLHKANVRFVWGSMSIIRTRKTCGRGFASPPAA